MEKTESKRNRFLNDKTKDSYASLVGGIKDMYDGEISNDKAHLAARNLLGFCQEIVNFNMREQQREEERRKAQGA